MFKVWKIAPGEGADHWEMCREHNCILLGWRQLTNYTHYTSPHAIFRALGGAPGDGKGAARSVWRFANELKNSDIVVANRGRSSIVGIGIVQSAYFHPNSQGNPSASEWLPHARLVNWVVTTPVDLRKNSFGIDTVHALSNAKIEDIKHAYLELHPELTYVLEQLFDGKQLRSDVDLQTEALLLLVESKLINENAFDPSSLHDELERVLTSIVRRRGQPKFRQQLIGAYRGRCAISGCDLEAVLEASHIVPYQGPLTNHPANGLLLRSDLHTLFDLWLISINPATLRILVSPKLDGTTYEQFRGKRLRIPEAPEYRPSKLALHEHSAASGLELDNL